jgi:hypothetical protein
VLRSDCGWQHGKVQGEGLAAEAEEGAEEEEADGEAAADAAVAS